MKELTVQSQDAGQRFDKFLAKYLNKAPKSFVYKMLRKKNITLNGKKAEGNEKLEKGDCVRLFFSDETLEKFSQVQISHVKQNLSILYEDEHILLINKPCGLLSQRAKPSDVSLVEQVQSYLLDTGAVTEESMRLFRPTVCNRLDRNTSGMVAAAKTLKGAQYLSQVFHDRTVHKYYHCLAAGRIQEASHLKGWLTKNPRTNQVQISKKAISEESQPIETLLTPVSSCDDATLLEICLITGRSHQIRAHLASIGHPIIGDPKYGKASINREYEKAFGLKYQLLHSFRLEMPDTKNGFSYLNGKVFYALEPELFRKIAEEKGIRLWQPGTPEA